jgi:hypothetical protein
VKDPQRERGILFLDSPTNLVAQYRRWFTSAEPNNNNSIPDSQIFPLHLWDLWWGLFCYTSDTAPIRTILTLLTYLLSENASHSTDKFWILNRAQIVTAAYQHVPILSLVQQLVEQGEKYQWLHSVLEDVVSLQKEHGEFKLSMLYDSRVVPSTGTPLQLLSIIPHVSIPSRLIYPPKPAVLLEKRVDEIEKNCR